MTTSPDARYRRIVEATLSGVWVIDSEHRTTFVNARMADMLGYQPEDMLGKPALVFVDAEYRAARGATWLTQMGSTDVILLRKDGSRLWAAVSTAPFVEPDDPESQGGIVAMVAEVTRPQRDARSSERLAHIVDLSEDAVTESAAGGPITSWNGGAERLYGYTAAEAIGQPVNILIPPDRRDELIDVLARLRRGEDVEPFETTRLHRRGHSIDVSLRLSALRNADGRPTGRVGAVARDISGQKRAESALLDSEVRYARLMQQTTEPILVQDENALVVFVNPAALRLLGASDARELIGTNVWSLVHADDHAHVRAQVQGGYKLDSTDRIDGRLVRLDQTLLEFEAVSIPTLHKGNPAFQWVIHDISARNAVERQRVAQAESERLRAAVSAALATDGDLLDILQRSAATLVEHLSVSLARIWTLNEADQILELQASAGKYTQLNGPYARVPVGAFEMGLIAQQRLPYLTNDLPNATLTGDPDWAQRERMLACAGYPLINAGRLVGVVVLYSVQPLAEGALETLAAAADNIARGIERKWAETALRESEARKSAILEGALDCIITTNSAGRITEFNPAAERTFGHRRADVLDRNMVDLIIPARFRADHLAGLQPLGITGQPSVVDHRLELVALRADGTEFPAELAIVCSMSASQPNFTSYLRDITDRRQAEAALRESQERYRQQYMSLPIPTYTWRQIGDDFVMEDCNDAATTSPGNVSGWIGKRASDCLGATSDGLAGIRLCAAERGTLRREATRPNRLTGASQTIALTYVFVPPDAVMTHIEDVTEAKNTEKQRAALEQSEKLRALGQMASGIAHDLNQSLMLIASYGDLARKALDQDPLNLEELRDLCTTSTQAAMDGGETVKRLLLFTRASAEHSREAVALAQIIRDAAQLTAPRWRDAAQVEGRPISLHVEAHGEPMIEGSPARIREIMTNLIFNAVDALPTGGAIRLHAAIEGDQAVVEVTDSGIGMTPDVQIRAFEPFFTTKGEGGTGLGLAMVFGIVQQHGGQVSVRSAPGSGTTFRMTFPLLFTPVLEESPPAPALDRAEQQPVRALRVLVVDDEPAMTRAVVRMLRPEGHLVSSAGSGEEALEVLATGTFDVVVSDMGMGAGMNGWDLVAAVKRSWPNVRFLLATGWGASIDPVDARAKGVEFVLAKPYRASELQQALLAETDLAA